MQSMFPGPQQNGDKKFGEIISYCKLNHTLPISWRLAKWEMLSKDVKIKYTKMLNEANAMMSEKFIGVEHYKKSED